MMKSFAWIACVFVFFCTNRNVDAVDRKKFRKCENTGFCRRNREKAPVIQFKTSNLQETNDQGVLVGKLLPVHVQHGLAHYHPLELKIEVYANKIVRARVVEGPKVKARWENPDVLLSSREMCTRIGVTVAPDRKTSTVSCEGDRLLTVHHDTFQLDLLVNDNPVVIANAREMFYFEQQSQNEDSESDASKIASGDTETDAEPDCEILDWGEDGKPIYAPDCTKTIEDVKSSEDESSGGATEDAACDGCGAESFGGHTDSKPRGPMSVGSDISFLGADEVYGIPEHATRMALKSTDGSAGAYAEPYRLYNLDVFEYELDEPMALYGAIPVMLAHWSGPSPHTAGIFWHNPSETFVDVRTTEVGKETQWMSESGVVDLFLMRGPTAADVLGQYASLTGTQELPPMFALAYHQCRWNYRDEPDVYDVDEKFEAHDFPYDVLWLDIEHTDGKRYFTWDKTKFPSPKAMQEKLSSRGHKMVTIVDPHMKRDGNYHVHKEAERRNLYVKKKDGKDFDGWCWPGSSSYLDFTAPHVREFWADMFAYDKYDESTSSLYTWNDMNEPSVFNGPEVSMPKDATSISGVEHREWHNMYGFYQHMATAEGLVKRNTGRNERPFVLTRAYFAGSQRHGAMWTGDNAAKWEHLEIATPMLLTQGIAGFPFSGADVGGFFGNPEEELLVRWYQVAAYQPFFRAHAHLETKRREPWLFGDEILRLTRSAVLTRYALLPYLYTRFAESARTGMPVMRPLWMHYASDEEVVDMDTQFLCGEDLLVYPVSKKDMRSARVYLPAGTWYDVDDHSSRNGGRFVDVNAPLAKLPVFQRGGSIIPRKRRVRRSSQQMRGDPYTLTVALDAERSARGDLYVDDEHSFDHKRGMFRRVQYDMYRGTSEGDLVLRSALVDGDRDAFDHPNVVERVEILGLGAPPSFVGVVSAENDRPLDFTYDRSRDTLTIRKPGVPASGAFEIKIKT